MVQTYITDADLLLLAPPWGSALSSSLKTLQISRLRLLPSRELIPQSPPCLPHLTGLSLYMNTSGSLRKITTLFPTLTSSTCRDWPGVTDPSQLQVSVGMPMIISIIFYYSIHANIIIARINSNEQSLSRYIYLDLARLLHRVLFRNKMS